ncbi:MAG: PEGA domain-containing protein [Polyangia bacterium]|jgi:hypothetical protein|nr:PEGA domain-containing protein [Polyangia bacterium]
MRRLAITALVLGGLCISGQARGQTKVAVFDLEAAAGSQGVATQITAGLRRMVSNQAGHSLAPGKPLAEIKLVFGCAETPVAAYHQCLAQVGRNLNADLLIFGKVGKKGGSFSVELTLLDVKSPLTPKSQSEIITAAQAKGSALDSLVTKWHGGLFGLVVKGTMRVVCNVPGATVNVDGRVVGECDAGGLKVEVEPGTRAVTVTRPGFVAASRMVVVKAATVSEVQVTLQASSRPRPPDERRPPPGGDVTPPPGGDGTTPPKDGSDKPKDPNLVWKALFYSTVSVGAAVLVASIFTGMKVKSLEKDKEAEIKRSWDDPNIDNWVTDLNDACSNNRGNQALVNICNKGENMAIMTNALIGVGAALVVGSGIFLWKAYFSKSGKEQPDPAAAMGTDPRFVFTPVIWESGGGASATFKF